MFYNEHNEMSIMNRELDLLEASIEASNIISQIPNDISKILTEYDISGAELGRKCGVSRMAISKWKRGICRPSHFTFLKLRIISRNINGGKT